MQGWFICKLKERSELDRVKAKDREQQGTGGDRERERERERENEVLPHSRWSNRRQRESERQ